MNKEFIVGAVSLVVGAALGSSLTYIFLNKKLDRKWQIVADKEIESVKDSYKKLKDNLGLSKPDVNELAEKYKDPEEEAREKVAEINDILQRYGVDKEEDTNYIDLEKARQDMETRKSIKEALGRAGDTPYEIDENEYGEFDDYTTITLTKYADGIVADERDVPMEDIERIIGSDWMDNDEPVTYIRNDALKCDYEISIDLRNYSDILKDSPYLRMEL